MRRAALLLLVAAALGARAEPATLRVGAVDYVSLEDGASALGLHVARSVPDSAVMLKSGSQPVARLTDHSREVDLAGLRVFLGDPVVVRSGAFYVSREDFEFKLKPRLRPELCGTPPRVPRVIALDAGHGGEDHGTENPELHTMEKAFTLDVVRRLKRMLEAAGYRVVLTRDTDVNVAKPTRSEIANVAAADVFVSVHFNSVWPDKRTTGVEVLSFPPKTQRSTDSWSLGHKDDAEPGAAPVNDFNAWNTVLAGALHRQLLSALRNGDRGEKFEHLAVLRGLKCPGALVEPAFISSASEGLALESGEYREKIAAAVCAGLNDYAAAVRALHAAEVAPPGGPAAASPSAPAAAAPVRSAPMRPPAP